MKHPISRRSFLNTGSKTLAAVAFLGAAPRPLHALRANNKLNIAAIGAGGKGVEDISGCAGENIVAIADVDFNHAAAMFNRFPKAQCFEDYRKMLETIKEADAVTVSIADHSHAHAAAMAMRLGKHVYCQKPLTHSVSEARLLKKLAREKKVATQMGNQGHSNPDTRRLVDLVQAGVLGKVKEVHIWTDRPIWPQNVARPAAAKPVPKGLNWDLWIGPAPMRDFNPAYHPFKWRGWWDFGTGALGDMACHNMDGAFWALKLGLPSAISAQAGPMTPETAPEWSIIEYDFPTRGDLPPVKVTWYDGRKLPPAALFKGAKPAGNGYLLIGDKDTLYVPFYWGPGQFLSGAKISDFASIPSKIPAPIDHYQEWINACKGGPAALSNFDYSADLTEMVLLGNLAIRTGKKIEWDADAMKARNCPEADQYIKREYRKGWEL